MSKSKTYKLILISKGLNTRKGTILIRRAYEKEKIKYGSIFLITFPRYEVDEIVVRNCEELGFENIFLAKDFEGKSICEMPEVDVIYVTEGNTFEIIDYIRKNHFDTYLCNMVDNGATYIGSSAGAILASAWFKCALDFDSNFSGVYDFTGFNLLPREGNFSDTVIPHYTYKQIQNYIGSLPDEEVGKYRTIYNIANDEVLILECQRIGQDVHLLKKRRIREE